MTDDVKYTSYSQFISTIDPCKEEEACLLRSTLIYPQNPALVQRKNNDSKSRSADTEWNKKRFHCYQCGAWYDSQDSLRRHFKFRHLREFKNIHDVWCPRWHCTKCKKEFGCKPSDKLLSHFCSQSVLKKDKMNEPNDLRLCAVDRPNSPLKIKRIRFESRIHSELCSIEQWLKYELIRKELTRSDYLNAAKMFVAVGGYQAAIELLQKSMRILKNKEGEDNGAEKTLIGVATEMHKKSKHKK